MRYRYYKMIDGSLLFTIKRTDGKIVEFYDEEDKQWKKSTYMVDSFKNGRKFREIGEIDVMVEFL